MSVRISAKRSGAMMMSPEHFYEHELKGKTAEAIMTVIRRLKRDMNRLKNAIEHSVEISLRRPRKGVQLLFLRQYLERAKEALIAAGGVYKPSNAELKAAAFNENIFAIREIRLSIGGFGYEMHTITMTRTHPCQIVKRSEWQVPFESAVETVIPIKKERFLAAIQQLHIGEWRRNYDASRFGVIILDGTQWDVQFLFSNGHRSVKIRGDNNYPYNFGEFLKLLGVNL